MNSSKMFQPAKRPKNESEREAQISEGLHDLICI